MGYDGKGQWILRTPEDVQFVKKEFPDTPLLLESFVAFQRELSILAVRSRSGETAFYPLVENHHRGGICAFRCARTEIEFGVATGGRAGRATRDAGIELRGRAGDEFSNATAS